MEHDGEDAARQDPLFSLCCGLTWLSGRHREVLGRERSIAHERSRQVPAGEALERRLGRTVAGGTHDNETLQHC